MTAHTNCGHKLPGPAGGRGEASGSDRGGREHRPPTRPPRPELRQLRGWTLLGRGDPVGSGACARSLTFRDPPSHPAEPGERAPAQATSARQTCCCGVRSRTGSFGLAKMGSLLPHKSEWTPAGLWISVVDCLGVSGEEAAGCSVLRWGLVAAGMTQVVERQPSKLRALSLNPDAS
jgi:hypothetical protein